MSGYKRLLGTRALMLAAAMAAEQQVAYERDPNAGRVKERKLTKAEKKLAKRQRHP